MPLPGDWRVYASEVYKMNQGAKEITVITPGGEDVDVEVVDAETYMYYYDIWEKWHYLQMTPHGGRGWLNEPKWIISNLIMFEKLFAELEVFEIKKARKK